MKHENKGSVQYLKYAGNNENKVKQCKKNAQVCHWKMIVTSSLKAP